MKKSFILLFTCMIALLLCACGHTHNFKDATCTEPKTCTECGATEGEPLGHAWADATCTEAKTCTICGATEGEPLGHVWADATCTKPRTCKVCGLTEGQPLGHEWVDATCTEPRICSVCGETEGEPLGHICEDWTVVEEPTCTKTGTESGTCTVCGETVTREVETVDHTPGDWEISKKATISTSGTKVRKCTVCGKELDSQSYQLDDFNISPLKSKKNFEYDDFSKSWKYYATYDKKYSDATESITIILFSEDNGTNVEDVEIRAGLYWKDAAQAKRPVKGLELLIDGDIYHIDMTESTSGNDMSYSFLYSNTSYQMIQALSKASSLKINILYEHSSTEHNLKSNTFKSLCSDIVKYNMWDYYIPSNYLGLLDTTTVR